MASELNERIMDSVDLFQQNQFAEAEAGFAECVRLAGKRDPLELAEALNNLSIAQFALSHFTESRASLSEALDIATAHNAPESESISLRASCLNNLARIDLEFEEFDSAEAKMLEAIALVKYVHPLYAAEISSNLARFYSFNAAWKSKIKDAAEDFEHYCRSNEDIEIYYDDLAGWRRPGRDWDRHGAGSPEAIQARILGTRSLYLYDSIAESKGEFEAILKLDEETKQVPPHVLTFAHLTLAEIAFHAEGFFAAAKDCEACLNVVASSYLRDHPASYGNIVKAACYGILSNSPERTKQLFNMAEDAVRHSLGEHNPHFTRVLFSRTMLQPLTYPPEEQLKVLRQCLATAEQFYPATHSWVIDLNVFLSDCCMRVGRFDEADTLLTRNLKDAAKGSMPQDLESKCLRALIDLRTKQGRMEEARQYLDRQTSLLAVRELSREVRMQALESLGQQSVEAQAYEAARQAFEEAMALASGHYHYESQKIQKLLALCLFREGKNDEASQVLGRHTEHTGAASPLSRRSELVELSHQAWALQSQKRPAEAKSIAVKVLNEAHLLMPECEESLILAVSVLSEQARDSGQAEELQRFIGIIAEYPGSLRLRCVLPSLYLAAAQCYAKQHHIKADSLFEQGFRAAEEVAAVNAQGFDAYCQAYISHLTANKKESKALEICQRLLASLSESRGKQCKEYGRALATNAMILVSSDPTRAEELSREAMQLLDDGEQSEDIFLYFVIGLRCEVLNALQRFEESKALKRRLETMKERLSKLVKHSL